ESATKITDDDYKLFEFLANTYYKLGKVDEAEKAFLESISLNKNNASSHYALGLINQKRNNFASAANYFEDGASVEDDKKIADKMLRHAMILRKKAGLSVSPQSLMNAMPDMDPPVTQGDVFDVNYSDLIVSPYWKEMSIKAKNAKYKPEEQALEPKLSIPNLRPGRLH
ncbi:MAG: tetratricopeptide repeat protein, partial [Candidatus Obscuribacterales bacterium]|nr:tetratricopeptide repeat protein [Candidatus Obscuribacterales bacterium]